MLVINERNELDSYPFQTLKCDVKSEKKNWLNMNNTVKLTRRYLVFPLNDPTA